MTRTWIRLAVAAAVAATALLAALPAGARGPTFLLRDAVGDAQGAAADIASISIWNEEDGTITFQLAFANRSALGDDDLVGLFIDTNENLDDGSEGAEYAVLFSSGSQVFMRWNGTDWQEIASMLARPGGMSVSLNRSDLGGVDQLAVSVAAMAMSDDTSYDGTGYGPFVLFFEPKLAGATMSVTPPGGTLKVGTRVTARVSARLDDGSTAKPTAVTCRMTLAGQTVKPVAPCAWKLPKAAKGKRVVITATGTYRGKSFTTKQVVVRVR